MRRGTEDGETARIVQIDSVGGSPSDRASARAVSRSPARRRKPFLLQPGQNEPVDVILRPRSVFHCRHRRPHRRGKRPVGLVFRPLGNPAPQQFLLGRRQLLLRLRPAASARRSSVAKIRRTSSLFSGCPGTIAVSPLSPPFSAASRSIQPQARLRDAPHPGHGRKSTCPPAAAESPAENRPCRPRRQRSSHGQSCQHSKTQRDASQDISSNSHGEKLEHERAGGRDAAQGGYR